MSRQTYELTTKSERPHGNKTVGGSKPRLVCSIYLPVDIMDELDASARRNGRTRSAEAREAITAYLGRNG